MRLWSLHPKYLDHKGLVAVWREALLAKKVLQGKTKGYTKHPQLERFRAYSEPLKAIDTYLYYIYLEACERDYNFDKKKCKNHNLKKVIRVNSEQIEYEFNHLNKKLQIRDIKKFKELKEMKKIEVNPIFKITKGKVESWEKK